MTTLGWFLFANVTLGCFLASLLMTSAGQSSSKLKDVEQQLANHIRYIAPAVSGLQAKTAGVSTAQLTAIGSGSPTFAGLTVTGGANFDAGIGVSGAAGFFSDGVTVQGGTLQTNSGIGCTFQDGLAATGSKVFASAGLSVSGNTWQQAAHQPHVTAAPSMTQFNGLLDALSGAGLMA